MKVSYILIGVFAVWCIVASQWYLFGVKGLMTDPVHFHPHETTKAIIEILLMLLIAVLLGFGIAWFLRQSSIDDNNSKVSMLHAERAIEKDQLVQAKNELSWQAEKAEAKLARAKETFREDFLTASRESEELKSERDRLKKELEEKHIEIQNLRPKGQLADLELGRISLQTKQLENQLRESTVKNQNLEREIEELKALKKPERKEPVYSDFIAGQRLGISEASEKDKDDLKQIAGIGPVIERKLNGLGIYTFRQISEFTPYAIEQVTAAIKFFPERIGRDNWIGQAAALMRHKK